MFLSIKPLPVFSADQFDHLVGLWIRKLSQISITKLEEEHWTDVYCTALGIPQTGFSNVFGNDTEFGDRVIEMKCIRHETPFAPARIMHPSLTRRVALWSKEDPVSVSLTRVIESYNNLIESTFRGKEPRWGILVYSPCLTQASYFEYPIQVLDISKLKAEYRSRPASDRRRSTTNMWVYQDDIKIMSVTSPDAGMKIQPYFQIPSKSDERYDIDLSESRIPVDRSVGLMIHGIAQSHGIQIDELIDRAVSSKFVSEQSDSSFSVQLRVVSALGGIGSSWQQELVQRILIASEELAQEASPSNNC